MKTKQEIERMRDKLKKIADKYLGIDKQLADLTYAKMNALRWVLDQDKESQGYTKQPLEKQLTIKSRSLLQVFSNAVIDDFESQIQTDAQKQIWFRRNCRNLKDILAYCNNDLEAAMFTIDATCKWLADNNLRGGYEAVCRNLPEMYSRAMKEIDAGCRWQFSPEIQEQIKDLYVKKEIKQSAKNRKALQSLFNEIGR